MPCRRRARLWCFSCFFPFLAGMSGRPNRLDPFFRWPLGSNGSKTSNFGARPRSEGRLWRKSRRPHAKGAFDKYNLREASLSAERSYLGLVNSDLLVIRCPWPNTPSNRLASPSSQMGNPWDLHHGKAPRHVPTVKACSAGTQGQCSQRKLIQLLPPLAWLREAGNKARHVSGPCPNTPHPPVNC